ncbi:P-loop containing nucleoside triphosphate hydrolase protein [Mycena vulgaris]|nr:P-loop containing nucleoside triphosphate hydrolase protein [Mycena vulgaris]
MLPGGPRIFHGRESELAQIVSSLTEESPRIAILGAGGMGKTCLARAALHHPDIIAKYEDRRFFIAADSTTTSIELAVLIAAHIGLPPPGATKSVLRYFADNPSCLLILDSIETLWERLTSRASVEDLLSQLSVLDLALIITMRGAERPAKVQWTQPVLLPLRTIPHDAARQTFIDIADDFHDSEDIDRILRLTDNLPLAVDLMAHLVEDQGCHNVLTRWETEGTSIISDGYDKRSNLDFSISFSLASPRLRSVPDAMELLLSILPEGLADIDLVQTTLEDPLRCKAALLRTTLAYRDGNQRLKLLVPVQAYIKSCWPPSPALVSIADAIRNS